MRKAGSVLKNKIEKVLFRDVVRACSFKSVKGSLLRLYPAQKKNINGYKDVFETLRLMRTRKNKEKMVIDIRRVGNHVKCTSSAVVCRKTREV
jgi:hypothetical protein